MVGSEVSGSTGAVALVTGAAGGIGGACARRLAQDGYTVVAVDVPEKAEPPTIGCDVSDRHAVDDLARRLEGEGRTPRVLVNAAGIPQPALPLADLEPDLHERVWRINYFGTFHMCRAFGPRMAAHGQGGTIVNISSVYAQRATPLVAYSPGKMAVEALTACLAGELGPDGVRINAVAPGLTLTPPVRALLDTGARDTDALLRSTCLHRFVEPDDVAAAVAFLCSDGARAITGISLPVDAGWLAASAWHGFGGVPHRSTVSTSLRGNDA